MLTKTMLGAALVAAMSPMLASCQQLECGEGTVEQDGECVSEEGISPGDCGPFTHYEPAEGGECVPDLPPTECGPNTVAEPDPVTGVIRCIGVGGDDDCSQPLPCAPPGPGNVSLCGKLYDVEDDARIADADGTTMECNTEDPLAEGPCSLKVSFYAALPFASNPTGTPELLPGDFTLDKCGRFAAIDLEEPMLGFMAIGIDDATAADDWVLAGVALPAPEGTRRSDLVVYGLRRDTDAAWTASAELVGQSFAERGVYVPIFLHGEGAPDANTPAVPVSGAVVLEDGAPDAAHTYYFQDTDPNTRLMPDGPANGGGNLTATSTNGSALMTDSELVDHSGMGGEPAGCKWPEDLAKAGGTLAGVAFIQRRVAVTDDLAEDVCP
jgi:hypothetical protein